MMVQLLLGSALMLVTLTVAGVAVWLMELTLARFHDWLAAPPHHLKLMGAMMLAALAIVTIDVWIWGLAFVALDVFDDLEHAVYFSLVSFTTLGYGDVLLPQGWRLLGGMAATNGLVKFGLLTAMLVELLRHLRLRQVDRKPERRRL